jgi:hypothetical protein
MGGSTSDRFGLPLEIGPAALVELTGAARAARGPVEYGGSEDQAEELAASLTLEVARLDDRLELERAARAELESEITELRADLEWAIPARVMSPAEIRLARKGK